MIMMQGLLSLTPKYLPYRVLGALVRYIVLVGTWGVRVCFLDKLSLTYTPSRTAKLRVLTHLNT